MPTSKPFPTRTIEIVTWLDSYGAGPGWTDINDLEATPTRVTSVGVVVAERNGVLVIAPHVTEGPDGAKHICGEMHIPRNAVVSRVVVNRGKEVGRE
ncbi:hypothetical protein [Thioalkalivibrio sp. ALE12]|uniref:hypothetical protein n=1 Tax=Thioalkalivibrio sp. ALE12 TaxID=1158170 RepID=UPI00037F9910|nr:hypothetical protein [Thioalkalivibrio sp. ALE12]